MFKVKGVNEDGVWSDELEIAIDVDTPYWMTFWFAALVLSIGIGIILIIILLIFRRYRRRNKEEKERLKVERYLLELEQMTLRLQMNPHFIFNSLNSIGNLIRKHNTKDARKYLDNFASLLRDVLNNNQENLIDLEQELTMCQKYLKLEALRFKDRFNYVINIENSIDLNEVFLPPLTLQPYIENAIWHGLLHKEKDCQLSISMERQANGINCIIEDNGIGRKESLEMKTINHKQGPSTGMKNIEKQIEILNKMNSTAMTTEVVDLEKETRVLIRIPFKV